MKSLKSLITRLAEADEVITYKGDDGKTHKIKRSSALSYDKDHPAYKAAAATLKDKKPKEKKAPTSKLSGDDFALKGVEFTPDPNSDLPKGTKFKLEPAVKGAEKLDKREVVSKLDALADMAKQAKEKGQEAPDFDLCQISIPGTNLFCSGNKGIPRKEMPQLKGKPAPGTPAAKIAAKTGVEEVDAEKYFKQALEKAGKKMERKKVPADSLKSTQSQLVGAKVAGMAQALEKDPNHPAITAPIFVSKDGYVLDGHHRWAAQVGAGLEKGDSVDMDVIEVDMNIDDLVNFSNNFADKFGIAQKAGKVKEILLRDLLKNII